MNNPLIFKEYVWLIETIKKYRKITLEDLSEEWMKTEMSHGLPLTRLTLSRRRAAILNIFGIMIECDRRDRFKYFIYNEEVLKEDSVQNWMISTLSVSNLLGENLKLNNRILLESIPSADCFLSEMLEAMQKNCQVAMSYRRYGSAETKSFVACPYFLKLFHRRWYVLMEIVSPNLKTKHLIFSLDRIVTLELLKEKFKVPKDIDAAEFFSECYGVVIGDGTDAVNVRLRAYGRERFSIQDVPIIPSQVVVKTGPDYVDVQMRIKPTADFKAFLASKGEWLIVLSPQSLADEVVQVLKDALKKYELFART